MTRLSRLFALIGCFAAPALAAAADVSIEEAGLSAQAEGNSGSRTFVFNVRLSEAEDEDIEIFIGTVDQTASAASGDYIEKINDSVTISAGSTVTNFTVTVNGDTIDEADETFLARINSTQPARTVTDSEATGTIQDDDDAPQITINNVVVDEGDSSAIFDVSISNASQSDVTVDFATADGSAVGGVSAEGDYVSQSGTLTFTGVAGRDETAVLTQSISVAINDDDIFEGNTTSQNFFVDLSNPANATIADSQGEGQINENDAPPRLTIASASAAEADGTLDFTVTVEDRLSESPITIDFQTGVTGDSATADTDYESANDTLTIPGLSSSGTISITLVEDNLDEASEDFTIELTNPSNATIDTDPIFAIGTIEDSNDSPTISFASSSESVVEGDGASITFTVQLSEVSSQQVEVNFQTVDGSAIAGSDYSETSTTVVFIAGDVEETVTVPIINDALDEFDEDFIARLDSPVNATLAGGGAQEEATGTIQDDDDAPALSIFDLTIDEDVGSADVLVTLSGASGKEVTFQFATEDAADNPARSADRTTDFIDPLVTEITIAAGQSSAIIPIEIVDDAINEVTEDFGVLLSVDGDSNATIDDGSATVTINDNDGQPTVSISDASADENASSGVIEFVISLSAESGQDVEVSYATSDDTASAGTDYVAASDTITIPAGSTSAIVQIDLINNDIHEADTETFNITLSAPVNATLGDADGVGTIIDDDPEPEIEILDVTASEGDAGTSELQFIARLVIPGTDTETTSDESVSFDFETDDDAQNPTSGDATAGGDPASGGDDFEAASGTITFAAGESQATLSITLNGDLVDEDDEIFTLSLSNAVGGSLQSPGVTGTITDDDAPPRIRYVETPVPTPSALENEGTLTVTAELIQPDSEDPATSSKAISFRFTTNDANGTASEGVDYIIGDATLTIDPGQGTREFTIIINDDEISEGDETFEVNLLGTDSAVVTVADSVATATIIDDEGAPQVSINSPIVDEGAGSVEFLVQIDQASGLDTTMDFTTADGTAVAGEDYQAVSGSLTISAGDLSASITVPIIDDNADEANQGFDMVLSNLSANAQFEGGGATETDTATITDNDNQPGISVGDTTVDEDDGDPFQPAGGVAIFTLTLSNPSENTITVDFATEQQTPVSAEGGGTDYEDTSGTATFNPGETETIVSVPIVADTDDEGSETFNLRLSNPTTPDAVINDDVGVATIFDNDGTYSINDVGIDPEQAEGDGGGTTTFTFTVSRQTPASPADGTTTVRVVSRDGTATSANNADYAAVDVVLDFSFPSAASQEVEVNVTADDFGESDETFFLDISIVEGDGTIAKGTGIGQITDDDLPVISIDDVSVDESANAAIFTLTKTGVSGVSVSVDASTDNGTAVNPADYTPLSQTFTFPAGGAQVQTQTFSVELQDDVIDEDDENFFVNLSNVQNATLDPAENQGEGTIVDNDDEPNLVITDVSTAEGSSGDTTTAIFTVSLVDANGESITSGKEITFQSDTTDGTAVSADDGATPIDDTDFVALTAEAGTIAIGQSSTTVTVELIEDDFDELDEEVFTVTLSAANNAGISDATGSGTIQDDDAQPQISIADITSVTEGNGGSTANADFAITLDAPSGRSVTVAAATANDTAVEPDDYSANTATVTFPVGETSQTFTVVVQGDDIDEADESFLVNLSEPTNASIVDNQASATITDDDDAPNLAFTTPEIAEGDDGDSNALLFTVSLVDPNTGEPVVSSRDVTVDYSTAETGTATAGEDFTAVESPVTLTIVAGENSADFEIDIIGDQIDEVDETVDIQFANPVAANFDQGNDSTSGTITDDDDLPLVRINIPAAPQDESVTPLTFTATLHDPDNPENLVTSSQNVTVVFSTVDGTATAGTDFEGVTDGSIVISAGENSGDIDITLLDDLTNEATETFEVQLTDATNATVDSSPNDIATGTIEDSDDQPSISIDDPAITDEGTAVTFTVTLDPSSGQEVTVQFDTADGSAIAGEDYDAVVAQTVTFAPGETSQQVTVSTIDDAIDEDDETFFGRLSNATLANVSDNEGTATIDGADTAPSIQIEDASATEGSGGTGGTMSFVVNLSSASQRTITATIATVAGTATATEDYVETTTKLTFAPGTTTQNFDVALVGDDIAEQDETFTAEVQSAENASFNASSTGTGTIIDDEPVPALSINDIEVIEGDSGTVTASFTISADGTSSQDITVTATTSDGTASSADDYDAATAELTIPAGSSSVQFDVTVNGDELSEADETFNVTLTNPSNAQLDDDTGIATITDDDDQPSVNIDDVSVTESGDGSQVTATFTVSLSTTNGSNISGQDVTVIASTSDDTASSPDDYTANSETVTIAAGEQSATFDVLVNDDDLREFDETYNVTLTSPTNASIDDGEGVGTIVDDEADPTLSIDDVLVSEGDGNAVFTVTLSAAAGFDVTVDAITNDGTATAPDDYTARLSGEAQVTIPAGQTSATVSVPIVDDPTEELEETFTVDLANPSDNVGISDAQGTATITDNDGAVVLSLSIVSSDDVLTTGSEVTYTATLTNTTTGSTSNNTNLTITLSETGFTLENVAGCVVSSSSTGTLVDCQIDALEGGASREFALTGTGDSVEDVFALARATSSNAENSLEAFAVAQFADEVVNNGQDDTGVANAITTTGDIDGDGDQDAVVASSDAGTSTRVLLNNGNGNLQSAADFADSVATEAIILVDLDDDGDLDLAMANGLQGGRVIINNGDAFASSPTNVELSNSNAVDVIAVELNGDEFPDLVYANAGSNANRIFINNGDGSFATPTDFGDTAFDAHALAAGDVNGDGNLDVVVANGSPNEVFLGDGLGGFQSFITVGDGTSNDVSIFDVDGNGTLDIVFAQDAQGDNGIVVPENQVFTGNGQLTPVFTQGQSFGRAESIAILAQDINGDGLLDVVVVNVTGGQQTFVNNGDGTFTQSAVVVETPARSAAAADLDGDGDADVIVGSEVVFNNGAGDLNSIINLPNNDAIRAGADSGGSCSMGRPGSAIDPVLPALAFLAMLGMAWRRRRQVSIVGFGRG